MTAPCCPACCHTAARVRALEEKLPGVERQVKRHLPHGELPSKAVGQVPVATVLSVGMAGHARWMGLW